MADAAGLIARTVGREEFRRWVLLQPRGRYERLDGKIVAMAPEQGAHLCMKAAVWLALREAIAAAAVSCQALPDGATVATGDSDFEPDALVNCGAPMGDDAIEAPNPVIVVEVLSPSTQRIDSGLKLAGYFAVGSIQHYVIVHPTRPQIVHHRRHSAGIETAIVTGGVLRLDPPGLRLDVTALYASA